MVTAVVERVGTRQVARQMPRQLRSTALVAVQHPAAREAAVRILRALGATDVLGASTVSQARQAAAGRAGEVCLVEATLPDGSGIQLAKDLRGLGWQHVIVLATRDDPFTVRAALAGGISCYLSVGASGPVSAAATTLAGMSQREVEVLQLVAEGHSNRDVGEKLGLSALTVKSHLARIARKLGTGDRAEMVIIGLRAGVIR